MISKDRNCDCENSTGPRRGRERERIEDPVGIGNCMKRNYIIKTIFNSERFFEKGHHASLVSVDKRYKPFTKVRERRRGEREREKNRNLPE